MNLTPIKAEELREKLNAGTVQFAFKKVNEDLRVAVGTRDNSIIPLENHPTGEGKESPNQLNYFDTNKNAWRSISINQEIFIAE